MVQTSTQPTTRPCACPGDDHQPVQRRIARVLVTADGFPDDAHDEARAWKDIHNTIQQFTLGHGAYQFRVRLIGWEDEDA